MNPTRNKISTAKEAGDLISNWKSADQKVVFTNGCFDILHLGHVDYLEKARNFGDRLVVAVNSDDSVKKIKGGGRPVTDELSRCRIIAALDFVDLVIKFDATTPENLIKSLKPDILVKGKDYVVSNIVGAQFVLENGGNVETIEIVQGYSTTKIIDKIKKIK